MTEQKPEEQTQYGFQYPDGHIGWHSIGRLATDYSDRVARAQQLEVHDKQVAALGIKPSKDTRIKFVARTVTTTYSDAGEVQDA